MTLIVTTNSPIILKTLNIIIVKLSIDNDNIIYQWNQGLQERNLVLEDEAQTQK